MRGAPLLLQFLMTYGHLFGCTSCTTIPDTAITKNVVCGHHHKVPDIRHLVEVEELYSYAAHRPRRGWAGPTFYNS